MTWPYEDHFINTTKYNSQSLNFTIEHEFSRMLRINLARPSHNQIVLVILDLLATLRLCAFHGERREPKLAHRAPPAYAARRTAPSRQPGTTPPRRHPIRHVALNP